MKPLKEKAHSRWSWLYALLLAVTLLVLELRAPWKENTHRIVEMGLFLILFGLLHLWVWVNEKALCQERLHNQRQALYDLRARFYLMPRAQNVLTLPASPGWRDVFTRHAPLWLLSVLSALGIFLQQ